MLTPITPICATLAPNTSSTTSTVTTTERYIYRNDPYRASVLPQILPQPPSNPQPLSTGRLPLLPVAHHSHSSSTTPGHHLPKVGFASRVKGDVARAAADSTSESDIFNETNNSTHHHHSNHRALYAYVRFKHDSCCYHLPFTIRSGDYVVVEADRGENVGMVERVTYEKPSYPIHSSVLRFATNDEAMALASTRLEEREVTDYVQECADALVSQPMRVMDVEYQFDRRKLTVFYESDTTVDFRKLQRVLFKQFSCRIWFLVWNEVHRQRR